MALRDLGLHEGDIFNWRLARKGIERLYGTDIYETVRLTPAKLAKGYKLTLYLERRSFPVIRFGARYDIERGGQGFAEYIYEDILGSGTSALFLLSPGEKTTKLGGEISADRIFHSYVSFDADLYYQKEQFPFYDKYHKRFPGYSYEQSWALLRFGQHLYRWGLFSAALKLERTLSTHNVSSDPSTYKEEGEERSTTIILESAVDTYDRYPFPRSGQSLKLTFQTAGEIFPDELQYIKFAGDIQRWLPVKRRWSMFLRLRGGYAEPTVPSWEKFSIGGMNDFAGLHDREVLGNQLFCGSVGLRFDLLSRFLAEAFITTRFDFAQIVDGTEQLEFEKGNFRQGISLSLALNTLLGPVELMWGWSAPSKNIPQNHIIYFSIGHEF
jgi:outer membrane protein assembly factor BamA